MRTKSARSSRFITAAEVADRCGVSPKTVGKWARTGVLPAQFTPTGHVRLVRADVEAALARAAERQAS